MSEREICANCGTPKVGGTCGAKAVFVYEPFDDDGNGFEFEVMLRKLVELRKIACALSCEEKRLLGIFDKWASR